MTKEQFGQWIKDIRVECEYTQSDLAKRLGFNHSQSIANIESGKTLLPKHCYKEFVSTFRLNRKKFVDLLLDVKREEINKILSS